MKLMTTRERLLASSMIFGVMAAAAATPALAQTAPPPPAPAAGNTDQGNPVVIVTGSHIPQPNLTSVAPVATVNNVEFKVEGVAHVEDLLNQLPQVVAAQGGMLSNGATGTAEVNLRNLGANRTLVLIDGRREMPGDPTEPTADLNFIPPALIDRVEIDTASASSIYGADAVAGVVNFIMKKDFQGAEIDFNAGGYQHGQHDGAIQNLIAEHGFKEAPGSVFDGNTFDVTGVIGVNSPDDKGNVTAYIGYTHANAITQATRDFSACSLTDSKAGFSCGGSATDATGSFFIFDQNFNYGQIQTVQGKGAASSFRNFVATDEFNYAPYNFYQRPDERYTGGFFAHYEVNKLLEVYSQFMFMDDYTAAQIAPSGVFGQTFFISCADPLLTPSEQVALCGHTQPPGTPAGDSQIAIARRNVEGGPRVDERRHTDYRAVVGARGDFLDNWHYDFYWQYGAAIFADEYVNDVSLAKAQFALNDCVGAPASGIDSGCVPWNIFQGGAVTKAATQYIDTPGFQNGSTTENILNLTINGDLGGYGIKSPWATDAVGIAFGGEYRREALTFNVDEEFASGDLAGQGGPKKGTAGAYSVDDVFGELRLPIVQGVPFFKSFVVNASDRWSDYTIEGSANTYAVGANWHINDDLMLRGGYNRAVRAPNVLELFSPQEVGLDFTQDPCAGVPTASAAQCARTGVSAAQYGAIAANPAAQYNGLVGGNPHLKPELADTWSGGFVLTPHEYVRGFDLSVDYFHINVQNAVAGIGAQTIMNECITAGTFCNLINRAPGTGSLWLGTNGFIVDTKQNVATYETSGVDVDANYRTAFSDWGMGNWGGLVFNFEGTYTIDYNITPAKGLATFNCVGLYGAVCQGTGTPMTAPSPKWRHTFRVTWNTPWYNVGLSLQWRYVGDLDVDALSSSPALHNPAHVYAVDEHLPSENYLDLEASWRIRDGYTARIGVNNVTDQDPPLIGSHNIPAVVGSGNTFPQYYDALGRYLFVNITADF